MVEKFVIYCIARVGSNFFINQLNNHPQILCHNEIFHPQDIYYGFSEKGYDYNSFEKSWDTEKRDVDPDVFISSLYEIHQNESMIGYNIFPGHNEHIFQNSLKDKDLKKIVLKRKDILKTFISGRIAAKTGLWADRTRETPETNVDKRVCFQQDEFLSYLLRRFNFYNHIETVLGITGQDYLTIYYEDFIKDRKRTLSGVFKYLGVREEIIDKKTQFNKQNPEGIDTLVKNYNSLEKFVDNYSLDNFFTNSNKIYDFYYSIKKKIQHIFIAK